MAGLDPAIHALAIWKKDVDAGVKPAHDDRNILTLRRFPPPLNAPHRARGQEQKPR